MSETTRMVYSVFGPEGCIESVCDTLREARWLVKIEQKSRKNSTFQIYRYDRNHKSDYCELIETYG